MTVPKIDLLDPLKVAANFDPFLSTIWDIPAPVTEREIRRFVLSGDWTPPHANANAATPDDVFCTRDDHMKRIAWLIVHGWGDSWIEVDVGVPMLGYYPAWIIQDGNHRFIAAVLRGDRAIRAACSGQVSEIRRYRARRLCGVV